MTALDSNNTRYQRDKDLNIWSLNWVLDANLVLCAACSAVQFARDADRAFLHVDGCASSDLDKYSWIELRDLLIGLSRMPN